MDIISTEKAPAAVGPYSQALKAGPFVFCSGQIGLDAKSGKLVGTDIELQTRQALMNLQMVLNAAGLDLSDVVRATVYLVDMNDFAKVNAIYKDIFGNSKPSRVTVQVAGLPLGALIEIACIAYTENGN